jgi:hypothetical protein
LTRHAALADLLGERAREPEHAGLGGRVRGLARDAVQRRQRGHVHDRAGPAAQHAGQHGAAAAEHARQVDVEHVLPVGVRGHREQAVLARAGIVDEAVQRAELGLDLPHELGGSGPVAQVEGERPRAALAGALDLAGARLVAGPGERDREPPGARGADDRRADAPPPRRSRAAR